MLDTGDDGGALNPLHGMRDISFLIDHHERVINFVWGVSVRVIVWLAVVRARLRHVDIGGRGIDVHAERGRERRRDERHDKSKGWLTRTSGHGMM